MVAKITLNKQGLVDIPTLILRNRELENIGEVKNYEGFTYSEKLNESNSTSFTVYKVVNGKINEYWDDITNFKILFIPEIHEQFQIKVSTNENDSTTKEVTCTPLAEAELSQINLYDVAINTEDDILRSGNTNIWDDYDENFPTLFYRNPDKWYDYDWSDKKYSDKTIYTDEAKKNIIRNSSMLHRVLEKAVTYKIGYVQETLWNIFKEFTFDDADIYSSLTSTIAEEIGCLFVFDSVSRTINVYDLYNTCSKCGYRGDFDEFCPECHSTDFSGQYGEDTTIFITSENLSSEITLDADTDSTKNCFKIVGGDDNITAAVANINPNGISYIYQIADWMRNNMPDELVQKLNEYDQRYNEYLESSYLIKSQELILRYNDIVNYVKQYYPSKSFETIPLDNNKFGKIDTYEKLNDYYYQTISLQAYLNDSMMPEMETVKKDIDSQLQILSKITSIAVNINVSSVQQGAVENAIRSYARCLIDTSLFDIDLLDSAYSTVTHIWTGKIQLTEIADDTNVKSTNTLNITVNDDVLNFVQEKVQKVINKKEINDITNIADVKHVPMDDFKKYLHYYSYNELLKIYQCFDDCASVITESVAETQDEIKKSVDDYRLEYQNRLVEINNIVALRKSQLETINGIQTYIVKNKIEVRNALDIQSFLGDDLYKVFFSYRREQKYSNDNYISDDLDDSELIDKARELFRVAKKELEKSSKITYTISATLNNLLAIPEFAPLRDHFEIGNWIHIEVDGEIYKLRLTSYEINYDDLDSISVEFSNVVKDFSASSSAQDILNAASSISTSYNALTQQMSHTGKINSTVKSWVDEGLDMTMVKIVNNAETQDVTMGTSGIYCRSYDDIKGDYDECFMRIINNGMYLFTNGGQTLKTAVGKFYYNGEIVYGVSGDVIVGNLIAGNNLTIGNADGNVEITKDGINISGGYLDISHDNKRVIIDPKGIAKTGYVFQVNNGEEISVGIKDNGDTLINAHIIAKSLQLGSNTISTDNISGLSKVATSGQYSDLKGYPDLTIYETKSNVDEKLKGYATSGDLKAYLRTDDLNSKLGELDVAYSGDVKTTQIKDETTGLITTTNIYKDSDGKTHSYTTYTYEDSNYVLLNRESKWGNGSLGSENNLVKISKDGLLEANNAIIHGEIYASKGTFSGSLSSATGTFSGALQCGLQDDGSYKAYISSHGEAHFSSLTTNGASIIAGTMENANIKFKYSNDSSALNGGLSFYDNAWEEGNLIAKTYCRRTQGVILNLSAKNGLELSSEGYITIGNCTKMGLEPSPSIFISGNGVSLSNVSDINSHSLKNLRYIDNISTLTFSSSTSVESDNTIELSNIYSLKSSTNKAMIIPVSTGRFNIMSTSRTQSGTKLTFNLQCRNIAPSKGSPSITCYIVEYQSVSTSTTSDEVISDEAII
nr:MAG TPA: hydrogenase/urease nickel incorporation protein [Bacteriophage sp.]